MIIGDDGDGDSDDDSEDFQQGKSDIYRVDGLECKVLLVYVDIGLNKNEFFKLNLIEFNPYAFEEYDPNERT